MGFRSRAAAATAVLVAALTGTGCDQEDATRDVAPKQRAAAPSENAPTGSWTALPDLGGRSAPGYHNLAAVKVGEQMVIVSGVDYTQSRLNTLTFDLASREWGRSTSPLWWRFGYSAIAAGEEVLIFGGCCGPAGDGSRAEGIRFDPVESEWRPLADSPLGDPIDHSAVWTGEEMIVWGGVVGSPAGSQDRNTATGAAYEPATDTWREISQAPIEPRSNHAAVWTGEEMIVWGGSVGPYEGDETQLLSSRGGAYDPETDTWREIASAPIRSRAEGAAVWTGEEMIVWNSEAGAAYDPETDIWRRLAEAPRGLAVHDTVVWTGERMLIWGGGGARGHADGIAYDPASDEWARIPEAPIAGRDRHTAAWTGEQMMVWGGCCEGSRYYADGALYEPERERRRQDREAVIELDLKPHLPPDSVTYHDSRQNVRITFPPDWVRIRESVTPRLDPTLAVSTTPLDPDPANVCGRRSRESQPQVDLGREDALVYVTSDFDAGAGGRGSPHRPRRFTLLKQVHPISPDQHPASPVLFEWPCRNGVGVAGLTSFFGADDRLYDVTAIVGDAASRKTLREALGVLRSLEFGGRSAQND